MTLFYSRSHIVWNRVLNTVGGVTAFWAALWFLMNAIKPDAYPRLEVVLIGTLSALLGVLVKGGKPDVDEVVEVVMEAKRMVERAD